jgi:hypothetical protein
VGLSFGLVQSILTEDLGMKCVSAKIFPKLLTVEQKETRLALARHLLQCADQDANFIKTIINSVNPWSAVMTRKQKPIHHKGRL